MDRRRAGSFIQPEFVRELLSCLPDGLGGSPLQVLGAILLFEAKGGFHPASQWVQTKCIERTRNLEAGVHHPDAELFRNPRIIHLDVWRYPAQPLGNDMVFRDRRSKQARGNIRHIPPNVFKCGAGAHCGRGANTNDILSLEGLAETPDQHGYVCTLPTAISVKLIQHQELQIASSLYQMFAFTRPGKNQFKHDVVGQQDIWRIAEDRIPSLFILLARVPGKTYRRIVGRKSRTEEFLHLPKLAVGQSVHRVNNNRLDAVTAPSLQDVVNDGYQVGEALA